MWSYYNQTANDIIELFFLQHPAVLPTLRKIHDIDFFIKIDGKIIPFDLKFTHISDSYFDLASQGILRSGNSMFDDFYINSNSETKATMNCRCSSTQILLQKHSLSLRPVHMNSCTKKIFPLCISATVWSFRKKSSSSGWRSTRRAVPLHEKNETSRWMGACEKLLPRPQRASRFRFARWINRCLHLPAVSCRPKDWPVSSKYCDYG